MDAINQDLAVVADPVLNLQEVKPFIRFSHGDALMSFDPSTREGVEMLVKAELLDQKELKASANLDIEIVHMFAKRIDDIDERGEEKSYVRMVIFDSKGEAYSSGAKGVVKSLSVISAARGAMPWKPPVKAKVNVRTLDGQKIWVTLQPDMNTLFPPSHETPKRAQDKR